MKNKLYGIVDNIAQGEPGAQAVSEELLAAIKATGVSGPVAELLVKINEDVKAAYQGAIAQLTAERDELRVELQTCRAAESALVATVESETAEAIAAMCDRMGWDHTADLIRDGHWKPTKGES